MVSSAQRLARARALPRKMPLWDDRPEAWHEVMPGVRRRILTAGGGVMMVLYRIAPNTTFPRHHHPHAQSGTVLSGGGRFRVGDAVWEIRAGSSYFVPSEVPHELVTGPHDDTVVLDVFSPEREDFRDEVLAPDGP